MNDIGFSAILGAVAWGSLVVFLVGALVGTLFLERSYRLALGTFMVATLCGFLFAFLTGFSIGRFVALLPLVVTAFAVTQGRSARLQLAAHTAAIAIYILLAWIVDAQIGYWGIQFMFPLCLAAYVAAILSPRPSGWAGTSRAGR